MNKGLYTTQHEVNECRLTATAVSRRSSLSCRWEVPQVMREELPEHFGNAASVCARLREADALPSASPDLVDFTAMGQRLTAFRGQVTLAHSLRTPRESSPLLLLRAGGGDIPALRCRDQ